MKKIFIFLVLFLVSLTAYPQAILRTTFTTNTIPTNSTIAGNTIFRVPTDDAATKNIVIGSRVNGFPGFAAPYGQLEVRGSTSGYAFLSVNDVLWGSLGYNYLSTGAGSLTPNEDGIFRLYQSQIKVFSSGSNNDPIGANGSEHIPALHGSGGGLADLPEHAPAVWANQPTGVIMYDLRPDVTSFGTGLYPNGDRSATQVTWTNLAQFLRTNNLIAAFTNRGIRVAVSLANSWLDTHRDANGYLQWLTNSTTGFPAATISPTNFINNSHNLGLELHLYNYLSLYVPTNGATELDIDFHGGGNAGYWNYPNDGNPFGTNRTWPTVDWTHYQQDVASYYTWGVDGAIWQDADTISVSSGYQHEVRRRIVDATINPRGIPDLGRRPWQQFFPPWNRFNAHGLTVSIMMSSGFSDVTLGAAPFSEESEGGNNGVLFGSNGYVASEPDAQGIGQVIGTFRSQLYYLTNSQSKSHFIIEADNLTQSTWGTNQWKHDWAQAAQFNATPFFYAVPCLNIWTNTVYQTDFTNSRWLDIWQDKAQNTPVVNWGATNGWSYKQLSNPDQISVLVHNESQTATTNMVVPMPVGWSTNTLASIIEVWNGTRLGSASNNLTIAVGPTNSVFVLVTRSSAIQTSDFVLNTLYTNQTPNMAYVSAFVTVTNQSTTTAATLFQDPGQDGTYELSGASFSINQSGAGATNSSMLAAFIPPYGSFYFSNNVVGQAGSGVKITPGSSQWVKLK